MTATEIIHEFSKQNLLVERYLLGELKGMDLEDFERHMFECQACFEEVKAGQELKQHIAAGVAAPRTAAKWGTISRRLLVASVCMSLAGIALLFVWPLSMVLADIGKALLFIALGVLLVAVSVQAVHLVIGGRP
jgi:anti-sigma factor RsiW